MKDDPATNENEMTMENLLKEFIPEFGDSTTIMSANGPVQMTNMGTFDYVD